MREKLSRRKVIEFDVIEFVWRIATHGCCTTMRGAVITTDGYITFQEFEDYHAMQKAVDGEVDVFPHPKGYDAPVVVYVNDTGKLRQLRCNHGAAALMTKEFGYTTDDIPVGNVVIVGAKEGSLTDKQEEVIRAFSDDIKMFGSLDFAFIMSMLHGKTQ